jgi:heme/copper-type cytochrome/quinol oxidase subunit 2
MHSERGERVWSGLVQEENGRECVWLFSFFFSFSFFFFFIFFFFFLSCHREREKKKKKKREKEKKVRGEESNGILFFVFFLNTALLLSSFVGERKKIFLGFFSSSQFF